MSKNKKFVLSLALLIMVMCSSGLKYYPEFIEQFYSNGLYVYLSKFMRYTFGWIPFSMGDILYTLIGLYLLRWLVINRKRMLKDTYRWLLDVGATLAIIYFAFHILWAFNYYRLPLYKTLNIEATYTTTELVDLTKHLIQRSNRIHNQLSIHDTIKVSMPFTKTEVFKKMTQGYDQLAKIHPQFTYKPKSIKRSIYSLPLTYMGFSGYFNPFTNEAQVDGLIPTYKFPTTSCHEAAHQLGYAAENEANFIGYLAAVHNNDLFFKYSGYTFGLKYALNEVYRRDKDLHARLLKTINTGILKNYREVDLFWKSYENPLEPVFKKTFDNFLKANHQTSGIKTYSYVVALLVNYHKMNPR